LLVAQVVALALLSDTDLPTRGSERFIQQFVPVAA